MSDIREGRVSRSSVESVWSHSTEKIGRGTHFGFRKFLVSENTIGKKRGGGGREYHDFPSKIFCFTRPKNFAGETFSASLI